MAYIHRTMQSFPEVSGNEPCLTAAEPDEWFNVSGPSRGTRRYAAILCNGCPILNECLQWSLHNPQEFGIWGGLIPEDRNRIINRRIAS